MELRGLDAIAADPSDSVTPDLQYDYIYSTVMRIAGGADEVLRNQIAERVLGMPGEVRMDIVRADADLLSASFNASVARWLTEWNFPGAAVPGIWRIIDEPEDLKLRSERDKNIYTMGYRPTLKYVSDTYGGEWEDKPAPVIPPVPGTPVDAKDVPAEFADPSGDPTPATRMAEQLARRDATQPVRERSAGSTFRNPAGFSSTGRADDVHDLKAWSLIDAAGLRGHRLGGAEMSAKHPNFLINRGGATAADLEDLGELVRARVKAASGHDLEWEVIRVGRR
jgi:hypothetical protein